MNQPFKMTKIYRYETKLLKTIVTIEKKNLPNSKSLLSGRPNEVIMLRKVALVK